MSWLSSIVGDIGQAWNDQPTWAKDTEIGVGAGLATFGLGSLLAPVAAGAGAAAGGATAAADTGFDLATIGPGVAGATDASTALGFTDAAAAAAGGTGLDAIDAALGIAPTATDASSALALAAPDAAAPLGATVGAAAPAAADASLTAAPTWASDLTSGELLSGTGVGGAPGAGTFASAAGGSGSPSFLSQLVTGASNSLTKNPLGIAAAGAGLGLSFLRGNQTDPNQQQLQAEAPQLLAQGQAITASGQQLQTYLTSGTLPPALQSQVTSAVQAEKARIIQNHASNGENTNPTQNSALAAELSQADINGINLGGQLEQQLFTAGNQLLQTGINETGLSTQLYETLTKMDEANTTQLMSAIASMAASLGGGTKIQIGGTTTAAA